MTRNKLLLAVLLASVAIALGTISWTNQGPSLGDEALAGQWCHIGIVTHIHQWCLIVCFFHGTWQEVTGTWCHQNGGSGGEEITP